jgi:hypothetical protein
MTPSVALYPRPRINRRRAVRRGASWTAAYHLQLTVGAVARPVRSSVGAPESLLLSGPGCCLPRRRLPGGASSRYRERSGVVAVLDPASRHATASVAGVSSMRCPPIRSGRPGSGCPAVRCPVTRGRRPEGSDARPSAVHPCGVQPSAVCPVRPDASVSSLLRRWRWGPGRGGRATVTPGTGGGPGGCRAVDGSIDGRRGRDAGDAGPSRVGHWEVAGGPGRPGWVRAAAAALAR